MSLSADNYLIAVEDLSQGRGTNPSALEVKLYENIAEYNSREAEHRAEKAVDGTYSIAINVHNFHPGVSYFSVMCKEESRRFRLVIYQVESHVQLGQEYHGEVCPGAFARMPPVVVGVALFSNLSLYRPRFAFGRS